MMNEHIAEFVETAQTIKCVCACGWSSPRSTCGNRAGWAYARAGLGDTWWSHAKTVGFSYKRRQVRFAGELIATIVSAYQYRLRGQRTVRSSNIANVGYTIATAVKKAASTTPGEE